MITANVSFCFMAYLVPLGFSLAGLLPAVALATMSRALGFLVSFCSLFAGVWSLLEAGFHVKLALAGPAAAGQSEREVHLDALKEQRRRAQIGAVLLCLSAFSFFLSLYLGHVPAEDKLQIEVGLLEKIERDAASCAQAKSCNDCSNSAVPNCLSATDGTPLRLSRDLEAALLGYLQKPPDSETSSSARTVFLTFLFLVAAGGLVWLIVKDDKAKTPLAIAAALCGAMVTAARHLPKPGGTFYSWIIGLLFAAGLLLLLYGLYQQKRDQVPHTSPAHPLPLDVPPPEGSPEEQTPDSPLILGFSLVLLAATLAFLAQPPASSNNEPVTSSNQRYEVTATPLDAVKSFGTSNDADKPETSQIEALKRQLAGIKTQSSDLLLLIGSADCTPITRRDSPWKTNDELAGARAEYLRKALANPGPGGPVPTIFPLLQHPTCKPDAGLRAVYSSLFQLKPATK